MSCSNRNLVNHAFSEQEGAPAIVDKVELLDLTPTSEVERSHGALSTTRKGQHDTEVIPERSSCATCELVAPSDFHYMSRKAGRSLAGPSYVTSSIYSTIAQYAGLATSRLQLIVSSLCAKGRRNCTRLTSTSAVD